MEQQSEVSVVGKEQIQQEELRRANLGIQAMQLVDRVYRGTDALRFAEFDLYNVNEKKAAVPYNVCGQYVLPIEVSE